MLKCPNCNQPIKYGYSDINEVLVLDADVVTIVTSKGKEVQGHIRHQCKKK